MNIGTHRLVGGWWQQGLAVAALSIALAGCGGSSDGASASASADNAAASTSSSTTSQVTPASSTSSTSSGNNATASIASANGTMIPSASRIVDSAQHVWSVNSGVVIQDAANAGYSSNVILLLYFNGTIYQESKACLWWSWNGSTWVSSANPAPALTPACSSAAAGTTSSAATATTAAKTATPSTSTSTSASTATSSSSSTSTSTSTSTSSTTPTGVFGIQVSGNKFVSAKDGSTVQIVGTNVSGLETGMTSRWASFANAGESFWSQVVNYGSAGVNTVRLPLNEASWLNYTCYDSGTGDAGGFYSAAAGGGYTPDPSGVYQATVRKAVADATAAGLYVILDLHWGAPNNAAGQPLCPVGQPAYADADHALAFWKSVADTFQGNPAVMFELFNEPFGSNVYSNWVSGSSGAGPDAITLRDGGAFYPFLQQDNGNNNAIHTVSMSWQVAGMQEMINTIRGEGATNVILSSPIGWAGEIETWLAAKPSDPMGQLGAAWHVYGYKKGQAPPQAILAAGYPIAITETYGLGAIGGYGWAASEHIGYTWWGWNDWGSQPLSAELSKAPWFASTAP